MKIPTSITNLMNKPMNRKEFLKHIGVASILVAGGGFVAKSLNIFSDQKTSNRVAGGYGFGYGSNVYGGRRR